MPPSTVYKGDLTEVTFGHESGMDLPHGYAGTGVTEFKFTAKSGARDLVKDTSVITFSGGADDTPVHAGLLHYPVGMLVGSRVIFTNLAGGNFDINDDYAKTGRTFTIVKHAVTASDVTELTITPALKTDHSSSDIDSSLAAEVMRILPFATPSMDATMTCDGDNALSSKERVLTDQFVGLVNTVTLPETKVDLKRFHVVGLGRDVAVQVPGRFLNTNGSFECNIHNARWLYYCLGHEVTYATGDTLANTGDTDGVDTFTVKIDESISAGDSSFKYATTGTTAPEINNVVVDVGDYVIIDDTATTDIKVNRETQSDGTWPTNGANSILSRAIKQEIRRIVAISHSTEDGRIWVDDPFNFSHAGSTSVKFMRFESDSTRGTPHMDTSTGNLTNPVERLLFSRTTVPSFAMEVSVRRTDADSDEGSFDGGSSDSKQLTRVFRGCKVKNFSLVADTDAALRLSVDFDSTLVYTDTGRLETTKGDRYDTHRLFEDTANNEQKRKEAGVAKRTQKPFMFYNGTIQVAGVQVGQVVSFTLNGSTGVQQYYTINGANVADAETDQVPFAGTRNASLAVEGRTEYDLEMEIIVDDPVFYHKMRRSIDNFDDDTSDTTDADMIRFSFTKQGTGATRESLDIVIDDYYITEAPLPIPEDKGPLRSMMRIMPKSMHVIAKDTLLHS
jgi:hypothetical protein